MLKDLQREWQDKKVAVVGLGISSLALVQFLKAVGARISGRDQKSAAALGEWFERFQALGIELMIGADYLRDLEDYDWVLISPGVPRDLPELQAARQSGRLSSEIELVFRYSPAPIFGITGSSGKTTTTSLVREMLNVAGIPVVVGGNIGAPLINELEGFEATDLVLLELSSFQLDGLQLSPHGALITNISENHLDVHHTMQNYVEAKQNIFIHQTAADFLVVNYDDPLTRAMGERAAGRCFYFSMSQPVQPGAFLDGDGLVYSYGSQRVAFAKKSELLLPGAHNVANFLAASVFGHLMGADWASIRRVGQSFSGVEHRLEFVAECSGVRYFNDSIATTPGRTIAALNSFSAPIILIAGGSDKQLSFADLGLAVHRLGVKHLILLGATAPKILQAVLNEGDFPSTVVKDLEEGVALAHGLAGDGDVVLLSPACASYDQYSNFQQRGAHFRRLAQNLK